MTKLNNVHELIREQQVEYIALSNPLDNCFSPACSDTYSPCTYWSVESVQVSVPHALKLGRLRVRQMDRTQFTREVPLFVLFSSTDASPDVLSAFVRDPNRSKEIADGGEYRPDDRAMFYAKTGMMYRVDKTIYALCCILLSSIIIVGTT